MKAFKLITVLAGLMAASIATATAGNALLDTLVKKGFLTEDEAKTIDKKSGTGFKAKGKKTKKIRVNGRLQLSFDHLSADISDETDPEDVSHFYFRRLRVGFKGYLKDDWFGYFEVNGAGGDVTLDDAFIGYTGIEGHEILFGYETVGSFGIEEDTSSSKLKTIERSIANRQMTDEIFDGIDHTGILASGDIGDTGLFYTAAIFNGGESGEDSRLGGSTNTFNDFGYNASLHYKMKLEGGKKKDHVQVGIAYNFVPKAESGAAGDKDSKGFTPYIKLQYNNLYLHAQYFDAEIDEDGAAGEEMEGYTFLGAYKINKQFEIAALYSHVDTNGTYDIDPDGNFRRSPPVKSGYDEMTQYYVGFNYYISGNEVKLTAGYEWAEAEQLAADAGANAEISGFRARLQLLF